MSRWDTCGAQAVIEAYGGKLCRLDKFVNDKVLGISCILLIVAYGGKLCLLDKFVSDKVLGICVYW